MNKYKLHPLALAIALGALPTYAQNNQSGDNTVEEVVVTGSYAQSLRNALNVKRESTTIVDSVFAEDVGKFPDQNLTESLGRIPGVAVATDDGEGRTITVRGLGDAYTMVTVNGMPGQSLAAGSGGVRTSRAFDFNVFASELFSRLDVYKSTSGQLEEGSLGATVSLRTGRPFDYDSFTAVANAEAGYYDGSGETVPRLSGLISTSNDTVGFLASIAYSEKEAPVLGGETGRWAKQGATNNIFSCSNCSPTELAEVRSSWAPRIPRYAEKSNSQERLGVTSSFQWQITEASQLTIDGLYSKIDVSRDEPFMEAISLARTGGTGINQMNVIDYTVDSNMTMVTAEIENADFRSEAFTANWDSEFTQLSAEFKHEFTDGFRMNVLAGMTESKLKNNDITVIYEHYSSNDNRKELKTPYADTSDTVLWDFTNMKSPVIEYSFDTASPANWELSEYRDRLFDATSNTDMFRVDFEYDFAEGFTAKAGVTQKSYGYEIDGVQADKTFTNADTADGTNDGVACGISAAITAEDGSVITAGKQTFFMPDFNRRNEFLATDCWSYGLVAGSTREVEEDALGYFVQLSMDTEVFGNRLRGDVGVREAQTDLTTSGITVVDGVVTPITVKHDYSDTLPSITLAYNLTEALVMRAAAAKVLARPELTDLNPGGSVTIFGTQPAVSYGNPLIEPFRADSFDLGFEWYYSEDAMAGLTLFQKDVESFPTSDVDFIQWSQLGLPDSLLGAQADQLRDQEFRVSRRINGGGAMINGAEASVQQQLSFLPGPEWVRGFGFQANYTYVDAEENDGDPMQNVSENSYNFTLYWEGEKFQARISNAYRGEYFINLGTDASPWQDRVIDDSNIVGVSASYDLTEQLKITFKGVNIFDEPQHEYETSGAARMVRNHSTGASYFVGASYKF